MDLHFHISLPVHKSPESCNICFQPHGTPRNICSCPWRALFNYCKMCFHPHWIAFSKVTSSLYWQELEPTCELGVSMSIECDTSPSVLWSLDTVGCQPKGQPVCKKSCVLVCWWWWWFDFARLIAPVVITTSIILSSNRIQNGGSLVPAYPGCHWKWPLNELGAFNFADEHFELKFCLLVSLTVISLSVGIPGYTSILNTSITRYSYSITITSITLSSIHLLNTFLSI